MKSAARRLLTLPRRCAVRIRDHERAVSHAWATDPANMTKVSRMRDVPPRVTLAAIIGHPYRFGQQLHKRWQFWTTLPGDHWHDFQSLKCFTAEPRKLRHPRPTFTASGGLLAGTEKEPGQHVEVIRVFMVAPGSIRQAVKTALALTALLILWEQPGFLAWLAALLVTVSIYALVLNAAHKR